MDYMLHPVPQSPPLQTAAPKAEFRRGNSNDTFTTSGDGDDDCSLVGADMSLDVQDHDGDGQQSRRNSSLPAMRASAEFANLHDLAAGGNDSDDDADGGDADKAKAASKEQERKWWWQKPSAEEADEQARATVHHDDSDNCAGARHGEDGEETTRDEGVISRRRSMDHQPIMRRASFGGMFGGGWMQTQPKQKEEEPEVDAEQAWANATWGGDSTRRASADDTMDKAMERLDREQRPPQQQPVPKPRARRATMSFGIMGELPRQHDIYDTQKAPPQPQSNKRSSLGFGPTNLLRGISGAGASGSNEPSSEELEQKQRAKELEDQSLSDMLAMLKAQRNSGRAGHANKTCTNVANAVIVKEYMEVQRRASMSFTDVANSSSATSGTGAAGSDANLGGNDSRRQAMPKRASIGFNILGGFGRNNQEQREDQKEQSQYQDSYSNMTELKPVRPVPARSSSLRQVTAKSSSLTGDGGYLDNGAEVISTNSSRPPRTARRSSMH